MKKIAALSIAVLFLFSCKKESSAPGTLPNSYSDQALGASANDMLSDAKYTTLNIQVQYMSGYQLDVSAVANVTTYLDTICHKPGGVYITQTQIPVSADTLNPQKVAIIEQKNRTAYTSGSTLVLYILVTDGFDSSLTTLGFAYRNTSICLFGKDIYYNSGGPGQVSRVALETSVLEHELGHLMGLVNLGTAMQMPHQDSVHGNHCINPACLMYYAMDTHDAFTMLHSNYIPVLDSNCRRDLTANGGR